MHQSLTHGRIEHSKLTASLVYTMATQTRPLICLVTGRMCDVIRGFWRAIEQLIVHSNVSGQKYLLAIEEQDDMNRAGAALGYCRWIQRKIIKLASGGRFYFGWLTEPTSQLAHDALTYKKTTKSKHFTWLCSWMKDVKSQFGLALN